MNKKKINSFPSELRFDIASRDWVVIAKGRAKRPESFKKEKRIKESLPKEKCPFCNIETQEKPTLIFANNKEKPTDSKIPKEWTLVSIPNKYPAFFPQGSLQEKKEGPFYKGDR